MKQKELIRLWNHIYPILKVCDHMHLLDIFKSGEQVCHSRLAKNTHLHPLLARSGLLNAFLTAVLCTWFQMGPGKLVTIINFLQPLFCSKVGIAKSQSKTVRNFSIPKTVNLFYLIQL